MLDKYFQIISFSLEEIVTNPTVVFSLSEYNTLFLFYYRVFYPIFSFIASASFLVV